jgi:type II secretory ATPase GspE/PulE/Tfp pilus assembly ATPase PilB-like protein/ActR/RegA family two-component response regulator
MAQSHWLKTVLARGGVARADEFAIDAGTPAPQAWAAAIRLCGVDESALAGMVARHFHLRVADLGGAVPVVTKLVPEPVVRKHIILPLRETDREMVVGTCNPMDLDAEQAVAFASGRQAVFEVAPPSALLAAIDQRYAPDAPVTPILRNVDDRPAESVNVVDQIAGAVAGAHEGESTAVVKLTNLILRAAIEQRATEVEIGPEPGGGRVSFRVDTVWRPFMQLPLPAMNRVVARTGLLGNLGIANRSWSSDGGARLRVEGHLYDLRVRIQPAGPTQRSHIRIFDQQFAPPLGNLGLSTPDLIRLRALLDHGEGMIVVAGPAGQGKSTLVAAALRGLTPQRRVASVEDPLERDVAGVAQQQPDARSGVTIDSLLRGHADRSVDALGVTSVLDAAVARQCLALAADTLVLLSVRAADGLEAVCQLLALGADRDALSTTLRGVVTVRLLRRACPHCAPPGSPKAVMRGCDRCARTGFLGVLPVLDIVEIDGHVAEAIRRGAAIADLRRVASRATGYRSLQGGANERVESGETTSDEVTRVFGPAGAVDAPLEPLVLIADDDAVLRTLARTMLEQSGFRVDEANDGVVTVERLVTGDMPSLLILDLDMPGLDGHAVLAQLRSRLPTAGLPVVVLTASENPDDELRAMELGADDYVRKPIDPPRFLARIRAALRRAST